MALTNTHLDQITEGHLQALIDTGAAETLHIEYKRDTYGGNDENRREFLADVSSFANARGGDLVIGMAATGGVPTAFSPFTGDADAEILRLDSMARTGLEPRIPNLHIRAVPIARGGSVLVIRVPRSYRGPHRVIFKGLNRFYARSSAGKYEPNVEELRALFIFAPELAERMRAFRFDRIAGIAAHETPVPLQGDCCLVLHVVPFSHFDLRASLAMSEALRLTSHFAPVGAHGGDYRLNIDGLLTMSNPVDGRHRAYVQLFQSGAVESVACISSPNIDTGMVDVDIIRHTRVYAMSLVECGAEPPFAVTASLIGVGGKMIGARDNWNQFRGQTADRDQLHLNDVVLEEVPDGNPNCGLALRPMLDQLANAAGQPASISFGHDGQCLIRG